MEGNANSAGFTLVLVLGCLRVSICQPNAGAWSSTTVTIPQAVICEPPIPFTQGLTLADTQPEMRPVAAKMFQEKHR